MRRRAISTTASCSTLLEREGWFEGAGRAAARPPVAPGAAARACYRVEARDTAQTHVVFGTDTFPLRDPRRFPLAILTNVFGGGMSSRLFQRVREELGLAYAVFGYKHFYQSSGQLGVYVGTQTSTADQAIAAIREEYDRLAPGRTAGRRAGHGKQQLKGQIMLSLESPMARMGRLAGFTLHDDRIARWTRCWPRSTRSPRSDVADVAAEFFPADDRRSCDWDRSSERQR